MEEFWEILVSRPNEEKYFFKGTFSAVVNEVRKYKLATFCRVRKFINN